MTNQPPRRPLGDFAEAIGDSQKEGSRRAYGLQKDLGPTTVAAAPPHVRQVVSGYDARPIGGYDFILPISVTLPLGDGEEWVMQRPSPRGYVTVLRRIELEPVPGLLLNADAIVTWLLQVGGIIVPNWEWSMGPGIAERAIDTFVVVPPETTIGLLPVFGFAGAGGSSGIDALFDAGLDPAMEVIVMARLIGNLILDANQPPTQMVGSNPHRVIPIEDPSKP